MLKISDMLLARRAFGPTATTCGLFCLTLSVWGQPMVLERGIAKVITKGVTAPGTAFVLALKSDSAWLLTSAHVVQGDPSPQVEFYISRYPLKKAKVIYAQSDSSLGDSGLAILVVANPPAGLRVLTPARRDPAVTEVVTTLGYPLSRGGILQFGQGVVSAVHSGDVFVEAFTDDGSSGGPVVHENRVVGMVYGQTPGSGGLALPRSSLMAYLKGKVEWDGSDLTPPHEIVKTVSPSHTSQTSPSDSLKNSIPACTKWSGEVGKETCQACVLNIYYSGVQAGDFSPVYCPHMPAGKPVDIMFSAGFVVNNRERGYQSQITFVAPKDPLHRRVSSALETNPSPPTVATTIQITDPPVLVPGTDGVGTVEVIPGLAICMTGDPPRVANRQSNCDVAGSVTVKVKP